MRWKIGQWRALSMAARPSPRHNSATAMCGRRSRWRRRLPSALGPHWRWWWRPHTAQRLPLWPRWRRQWRWMDWPPRSGTSRKRTPRAPLMPGWARCWMKPPRPPCQRSRSSRIWSCMVGQWGHQRGLRCAGYRVAARPAWSSGWWACAPRLRAKCRLAGSISLCCPRARCARRSHGYRRMPPYWQARCATSWCWAGPTPPKPRCGRR